MSTDPATPELHKLQKLANKIEKLLRDEDVAGIINLQGKEFSEFRTIIDPSWSALKWQFGKGGRIGVRFTCKMATGTPEEKEKGRLTVGMIHGFEHICKIHLETMTQLRQLVGEHIVSETKFTELNRPNDNPLP